MSRTYSSYFLVLIVALLLATPCYTQNWDEVIKAVASDRQAGDEFGQSVAISGDYAIVGAHREDNDLTGGATLSQAGSVYIFHRSGGTWTQQQKIVAPTRAEYDRFGISVAISGDYAIIGAHQEDHDAVEGDSIHEAGSAYIFHRSGATWTQQQKIVASDRAANDLFGFSVSISGDYAVVGSYWEDHDASGGDSTNWAGSAYIFHRSGSTWAEQQKIVASDRAASDLFGWSVAISDSTIIVGAYAEDSDASGGAAASNAGSAYIFNRSGGTWVEQQKIVASDRAAGDLFGWSVAISDSTIIVGAPREDHDTSGGNQIFSAGAAYIYKLSDSTWTQQQKIVASDRAQNDYFAHSVAISANNAIIGAYWEDHDASGGAMASNAGSAYTFNRSGSTWMEQQKIVASDRAQIDQFGWSAAISDSVIVVGAPNEDEDQFGGASASSAGSVYFFDLLPCSANTSSQTEIACDTYTWSANSQTYTITGTYIDTLTNVGGCDSVLTLNLTINISNTGSQNETACDTYTWAANSTTYTSSGTYTTTLTNVAGCDSVATLNLTINSSNTGSQTETACDTYTWPANSTTYTSSGTYTTTLTNAAGCDSVVALNLTINSSNTGSQTETACDTYTWAANSTTYTSSGTYTSTLTNAAGCDSVVTLNLTINSSNTGSQTATACDTYTWAANSTTYTSSGTYTTTLTNAAGCDSVVTLNLTINSSNTGSQTETACDTYTWAANSTTYTSSGTYTSTLTNAAGCDSVVTLNLTINSSNTGSQTETMCDTYTWAANSTTYTASGTYTTTLTNLAGCDSVVTLNLTINSSNTGSQTETACDTYTWPANSTTYTSSGTYTTTLTNAAGCDSVVTLNLTINSSNTGSQIETACDTYTWPANSTTYTSSGTYITTLTNVANCDSVVTLNLTINSSSTGSQIETACDTYTWPANSTTYTSSGTYMTTLANAAGCDSLVTLNLTINQVSDVSTSLSGTTITANNTTATYQWLDCLSDFTPIVGETSMSFVATSNGDYSVELTENGCSDTSACTSITTVDVSEIKSQGTLFTVHPNPSIDGHFIVKFETQISDLMCTGFDVFGQLVHSKQIRNAKSLHLDLSSLPSGVYLFNFTTPEGSQALRLVKQ